MIRLARKPSVWSGFLGRLAFGIVWAGSMITATWFVWTRGAGTPILAWVFLGILDLFAIGIVWDLVIRFWRTINGRQPVLSAGCCSCASRGEIDRPSLRYAVGDVQAQQRWKIVVTTELRQGGVIEHAFPIAVEARTG